MIQLTGLASELLVLIQRKMAQKRFGAKRWNNAGQGARARRLLHHEAEQVETSVLQFPGCNPGVSVFIPLQRMCDT